MMLEALRKSIRGPYVRSTALRFGICQFLLCVLIRAAAAATPADLSGGPIRIHPENSHCLIFKGKPTVLITSAERYGAMINKDFDYVAFFDTLKSYGLDYTRIYPGAMFEPMGKFLPGNTLGPKPQSLIVPWTRSHTPGYLPCGNKFDLDRWDPEYFVRPSRSWENSILRPRIKTLWPHPQQLATKVPCVTRWTD